MALEACNAAITQAIGRELTEREKNAVQRRYLYLKRKLDALPNANDPSAVEAVLKDFADETISQAIIAERNTALNHSALQSKTAMRKSIAAFTKDPKEGIKAMLAGSLAAFQNSKNSLASLVGREIQARSAGFVADLEAQDLTQYAFKGGDDLNIGKAIWHLRQESVDQTALARLGDAAVKTAKVIKKHQDLMRADLNRAGAWIGENSDYIVTRAHDSYKIAKAGGHAFGSNEAFEAWKKSLIDGLDWQKSFDGDLAAATPAERSARLRSLFDQFANGYHLSWKDVHVVPRRGFQNIGQKESHRRVLVFDSPEADIRYQLAYGRGDSLAQSQIHSLYAAGRDLAIMREWGPNAALNLEKFKTQWMESLHTEGRSQDAAALAKEYEKQMRMTWPTITGEIGHPAHETAAHWSAASRALTIPAKLGSVVLSSFSDLALRASNLNYYGIADSFFVDIAKGITGQLAGVGHGLSKSERNLAAEFGVLMESIHVPVGNHSMESIGLGRVDKAIQLAMKWFGASWWSNRVRMNTLAATGLRLFQHRDTLFALLPKGMRSGLEQFGITQDEWNIIRSSVPRELGETQKVLSPSAVLEMDLSHFRAISTIPDAPNSYLTRLRSEVAAKFRNYFGELADRTTAQPDITTRSMLLRGTKAGTWEGEALRHLTFLKNFTANYMRNHLGRELYGHSDYRMSMPEALFKMLTFQDGGSAFMGMSNLIASGVVFGYVQNSLRDLSSGKTPTTDWRVALPRALFAQSLGLYSDFLFGQRPAATTYERLGALAGPTIGTGATVGDIIFSAWGALMSKSGMTEEKARRNLRRIWQLIYSEIPGQNLFYTRWATDYAVLYNISELINPGYMKRVEKANKSRGQTLLLAQ